VADVDGVDRWGSRRIRGTLICAGSCFEAARQVCLDFLFGGAVVIKKMCVVNFELDQIREVAPWGHGHKSRKSRESSLDVLLTFGSKAVSDLTCPLATVAYSEESLVHMDKVC